MYGMLLFLLVFAGEQTKFNNTIELELELEL